MRPITLLSILYSPKSDKNGFHSSGGSYSSLGCSPPSFRSMSKKKKKMHLLDWGLILVHFSLRLYLPAIQILPWQQLMNQLDSQEGTHFCELHLEQLIMRKIRHSGKWGEGDLSNTGWVPKAQFEKWMTGKIQTWRGSTSGATTSMA